MTTRTCPQGWGLEMCAFAHDHGDKAPMPGEPDRAIESEYDANLALVVSAPRRANDESMSYFDYVGRQTARLNATAARIGDGCFRAMAAAIEE